MLLSKLKIGEMDIRLVIQANTPTYNVTTNEPIDSWATIATVWAKRILKGGREGFESDQVVAMNTETYLIRYSSEVSVIDATYRVFEVGTTDYFNVNLVEKQKREGVIMVQGDRRDG